MKEEWWAAAGCLALALVLHVLSAWLRRWLERSESAAASRLRSVFTPDSKGHIAGLYWVHLSFILMLWTGTILIVLRQLGWQEDSEKWLNTLVDAGFTVAGFQIVPVRILLGLFVAAILISLARGLRMKLINDWLVKTQWDAGARESVATLISYVVIVLAILLGISVAGFSLTNLAIIAGALSVGIGFGLQNIVNNFVSGLILLSERPVRRGDFVRVGEVEGEVRQVHIRATEIETLDRISVVVPNSDLISSPVFNWRLRDPYVRITIHIGVAYGSDVELVMRLLREVALAHELTLPDNTRGVPNTHVYFTDFGDSALMFELRTYTRDVNQRGRLASDVRVAIDRAFREHRITIPFPQRDVWMKSHVES